MSDFKDHVSSGSAGYASAVKAATKALGKNPVDDLR